MDYIGSKEKLNKWIFSIILDKQSSTDLVFLDGCSGSGSASKYAAKYNFKKIISNDIMEFPSHLVRGAICLPQSQLKLVNDKINAMNDLSGISGFFYNNYSQQSGKLYFSDENARKIDACRDYIEKNHEGDIYIKSYLIYCLIEALSRASNTTGVQAAFLKKLKDRAIIKLKVNFEETLHKPNLIECYNQNILTLLNDKSYRSKYKEDILYLDPPYNQRQYGPNYHLYETLAKNDQPKIHGKTGLRDWQSESKSDFCSKKTCLKFTKSIVDNTTAKNVYISYSSDGLLHLDEFRSVFGNKMTVFELDQKRYKSDASDKRNHNTSSLKEYLINIQK